jgi:hypothetical protein
VSRPKRVELLKSALADTVLRQVVPKALESVKYWRCTQRINQVYREGAVFGDKQYKERVYKSHWRVSQREPEAGAGTGVAAATTAAGLK